MWKTALAAILSLCVGVTSALAQTGQVPQFRNDSNTRWGFSFTCGGSGATVVLDPNQSVFLDPKYMQQACSLVAAPVPNFVFQGGNINARLTASSVCGVTRAGAPYCSESSLFLTLQIARVDKPVIVLFDGVAFGATPILASSANRTVQPGTHTLTLIGTGKGSFDISAVVPQSNGTAMIVPLIKGQAPNGVAGDTWMISKVIQVDPPAAPAAR